MHLEDWMLILGPAEVTQGMDILSWKSEKSKQWWQKISSYSLTQFIPFCIVTMEVFKEADQIVYPQD